MCTAELGRLVWKVLQQSKTKESQNVPLHSTATLCSCAARGRCVQFVMQKVLYH